MISPTEKQQKAYEFIVAEIARRGVAPSLQELADHLHLKSRGSAHRLVTGLEQRGLLRRIPNHARAMEVIPPTQPLPQIQSRELLAEIRRRAERDGVSEKTIITNALRAHFNLL